jgi:formate hydrogenlyase subunit 3/multisubunit Na+/H+ antiporter MnhD subunit
MLALGALGFITGELAAWRARDLNRMLAYSSIGQLGLVFIGFSLSGTAGLLAGLALALHHLVIKAALFGLATRWGGSLERLVGAARSAPIASGLMVLFALSLIGVPPLPGFWAKLLVVMGLAEQSTTLSLSALALILIGTAVEANYLFRLVIKLYARGEADAPAPPRPKLLDLGIASAAGVLLLVATVGVGRVSGWLGGIASQAADREVYIRTVFPPKSAAVAAGSPVHEAS